MNVRIFGQADEAARAVADRIQQAVMRNPASVLGLPTGRTPLPVYAELRRRCAIGELDLSRVTTFNLDEFVGLPAGARGSFRRYMDEQLFGAAAVAPDRIHFLNGLAPDLPGECGRYEAEIAGAGGIDLLLLGIGSNGHVGFNEPGPELVAATHVAHLRLETRQANAHLFGGDISRVPERALTMGMATILRARRVILMATGERKASCVAGVVNGPITTHLPASFLQLHSCAELCLDLAAAARLS